MQIKITAQFFNSIKISVILLFKEKFFAKINLQPYKYIFIERPNCTITLNFNNLVC
jgi:hypothetical protein